MAKSGGLKSKIGGSKTATTPVKDAKKIGNAGNAGTGNK